MAQITPLISKEPNRTARELNLADPRRLACIVESLDDAIITKSLDGNITSWNVGAERMFGYRAEEVIGEPITIIPADRLGEETRIISRIRRGGRVQPYDTVRRCKDGSLIEVSLSVSPVRDAKGKIIGASKIARDITERILERQGYDGLVLATLVAARLFRYARRRQHGGVVIGELRPGGCERPARSCCRGRAAGPAFSDSCGTRVPLAPLRAECRQGPARPRCAKAN